MNGALGQAEGFEVDFVYLSYANTTLMYCSFPLETNNEAPG